MKHGVDTRHATGIHMRYGAMHYAAGVSGVGPVRTTSHLPANVPANKASHHPQPLNPTSSVPARRCQTARRALPLAWLVAGRRRTAFWDPTRPAGGAQAQAGMTQTAAQMAQRGLCLPGRDPHGRFVHQARRAARDPQSLWGRAVEDARSAGVAKHRHSAVRVSAMSGR